MKMKLERSITRPLILALTTVMVVFWLLAIGLSIRVMQHEFDEIFDSATGASDRSSGQFAVHFTFDVTPNATGRRVTLEEIGVYTVKDNQIAREQFYYEGER